MARLSDVTLVRLRSLLSNPALPKELARKLRGEGTAGDWGAGRVPTPNERYWLNVLRDLSEVDASLRTLGCAAAYLSLDPPGDVWLRLYGTSEAVWLRYHLEMYLQEEYILRERLRGFLARVERAARRSRDLPGARVARSVRDNVERAFREVVQARGRHVHAARLRDLQLGDLEMLVLVTRRGRLRRLRKLRGALLDLTVARWRGTMLRNNRELRRLCDRVFDSVRPVVTGNEPGRVAL